MNTEPSVNISFTFEGFHVLCICGIHVKAFLKELFLRKVCFFFKYISEVLVVLTDSCIFEECYTFRSCFQIEIVHLRQSKRKHNNWFDWLNKTFQYIQSFRPTSQSKHKFFRNKIVSFRILTPKPYFQNCSVMCLIVYHCRMCAKITFCSPFWAVSVISGR